MWNDETSHCGGELCGTMKPVTGGGELCGTMKPVTVEVSCVEQ